MNRSMYTTCTRRITPFTLVFAPVEKLRSQCERQKRHWRMKPPGSSFGSALVGANNAFALSHCWWFFLRPLMILKSEYCAESCIHKRIYIRDHVQINWRNKICPCVRLFALFPIFLSLSLALARACCLLRWFWAPFARRYRGTNANHHCAP